MVEVGNVQELLDQCDPDRFEFPRHVHERAMQRNVDLEGAKQKLRERDITAAQENSTEDPAYEYTFRVTVSVDGERYEMLIYFNVPGTNVLVKSIWPR